MKKRIIICLVFVMHSMVFSQNKIEDDTKELKGKWIVTNQFGTAILKAENLFKINASVFEGTLSKEFVLNEKVLLVSGIENLRVKGDFYNTSNEQLFIVNNYLIIPITVKFYYDIKQKFTFFGELGFYGSYLYKSKIENITLNYNNTNNGLGFNFGLQLIFGANYQLDDKWSFNFGFKSKGDLLNSYKDNKQEFELREFYAFQFGLGLRL